MDFNQNIPMAASYKDALLLFKTDVYRLYGKIFKTSKVLSLVLKVRCLRFLFFFRMAQYERGWAFSLFVRLSNHYADKYGLFIYPETKIGYGIYLGHGFNTVVNASAVLGNNINLSHGVTIGSNTASAAVIGDNVYIGPNVCTVENCHIGNGVTIGAGSIVTRDIPENKTAVGVPARVIGDSHPEYIGNAMSMAEFKELLKRF